MTQVFIGGVPFLALGHHDGRFVRTGGLFAFARRLVGGEHLVLHFEMTQAINRVFNPSPLCWGWRLGQSMDTRRARRGKPTRLWLGARTVGRSAPEAGLISLQFPDATREVVGHATN